MWISKEQFVHKNFNSTKMESNIHVTGIIIVLYADYEIAI